MYKVCAHYCGTIILLDEFENLEDAKELMKHDYVLTYADESEDGEEEWIYSDEMFIDDDDTPFSEVPTINEIEYAFNDDLPF